MTNSNLRDFGNFHANLAQSAYTGRPSNFPFDSQRDSDKDLLNSGQSLYFDFSQDNKFYNKDKKEWEITPGGKHLPHNGKVYLQPDPELHTIEDTMDLQLPNANGGYRQEKYVRKRYQKGLLTDE